MPCCMENSVDPDQLASEEASWSGSTLFSFQFISGFILFFKEFMYGYQQSIRDKLGLFFGTSFVWFDSLRPINNLSVIKGRVFLGWTSSKLGLLCLAHTAETPVRLKPAAPQSPVKHSTTEPLCSLRPTWSHLIKDKFKIPIYLSWDKYKER